MSIKIRPCDIESRGGVAVSSPGLVNALIKDKNTVLRFLAEEVAPVNIDQIFIDPEGKIIVTDPKFAEVLRAKIGGIDPGTVSGTNTVCGLGC